MKLFGTAVLDKPSLGKPSLGQPFLGRAFLGKAMLVGFGLAASVAVSSVPASAQYYQRGYDRYDDGYGRGNAYGRGGYGRNNIEAQKRAIKAQREAQKRAVRGGYGQAPAYGGPVGRGAYRGGDNGPTGGGFAIAPGPGGGYAVPVTPGNAGRYGNPQN